MRTKVLIVVVAVVLGLLAAFFGARYLSSARTEIAKTAEPVKVLVATRDVPKGTPAEDLVGENFAEVREIPRQYVAEGAIASVSSIEGKVLAVALTRGEQVTGSRFIMAGDVGLSYVLPEGYVAVSVPDNPSRGVSGFVKPGDYVMVISSFDPGGVEEAVTKVLIKKARVLATGTETVDAAGETSGDSKAVSGAGEDAGTVVQTLTLAVTPVDAERLVFSQEVGSVWYALLSSSTAVIPDTAGERFGSVLR